MKKLLKLKLNQLRDSNLSNNEMRSLLGGGDYDSPCTCSCYWEGNGGSATADNAETNARTGYSSSQGCNQYQFTPGDGWEYCDVCTA